MRTPLLSAALAVTAAVSAPLAGGADAARPQASLAVSPAQLSVTGPSARQVVVRNDGSRTVTVDATRIRLGRRPAASWLRIAPRSLTLRPGARGALTVRVVPPRRAAPGDHHALVLLTTRPLHGARIAVRMRVGVVVRERVPGRVVRRLKLGAVAVRRVGRTRMLSLSLVNRGNVAEDLPRGRVVVSLVRRGRIVARLLPHGRSVLPLSRGTIVARYRGRVRGPLTALVQIRGVGRSRHRVRF